MNGHRQTGSTGPFRVRFYPRRIIANKAARKDEPGVGIIVVVMEWLRRLIISGEAKPSASQARSSTFAIDFGCHGEARISGQTFCGGCILDPANVNAGRILVSGMTKQCLTRK